MSSNEPLSVYIKRFDRSLPLPSYQTKGAAALDLYSRIDVRIKSQAVGLVPFNVALQIPKDCWVLISARSSIYKKGLVLANGIGVGDHDYRGDDDEYMGAFYNWSKKEVKVKKGERLAQMIVMERRPVNLIEKKKFNESQNRGGLGSTGW